MINQVHLSNPPLLTTKPFSCHKCNRTFNSKYNVIRHLKQYHADKRMFKCNVCGRDYKWIDSLHKHMKIHKLQQQQAETQQQLELKENNLESTVDSGVVVLDEKINEEIDLETEDSELIETDITRDIESLIDDDSLIILSPKTIII